MSAERRCMVCGRPSTDTICDSCKANIQGEARAKKKKVDDKVEIDAEKIKRRAKKE